MCPPELKVRTPAHTKQLGGYVEFDVPGERREPLINENLHHSFQQRLADDPVLAAQVQASCQSTMTARPEVTRQPPALSFFPVHNGIMCMCTCCRSGGASARGTGMPVFVGNRHTCWVCLFLMCIDVSRKHTGPPVVSRTQCSDESRH